MLLLFELSSVCSFFVPVGLYPSSYVLVDSIKVSTLFLSKVVFGFDFFLVSVVLVLSLSCLDAFSLIKEKDHSLPSNSSCEQFLARLFQNNTCLSSTIQVDNIFCCLLLRARFCFISLMLR